MAAVAGALRRARENPRNMSGFKSGINLSIERTKRATEERQRKFIKSLEQMNNLLTNENRALRNKLAEVNMTSNSFKPKNNQQITKLRNLMRKYKSQLTMREYTLFKMGRKISRKK